MTITEDPAEVAVAVTSDILMVEDIGETVEGLILDLRARGGKVFRADDAETARQYLNHEPWDLVLFDLRIPPTSDAEPQLETGLRLISEWLAGDLGDNNERTLFGIITMQDAVAETDQFKRLPTFIGIFRKSEDPRRLFRVLKERSLIGDHELDESEVEVVRRRVKFMINKVDIDNELIFATLPVWGNDGFQLKMSQFLPNQRRLLSATETPFFVYGHANVAAMSVYELEPAGFEDFAEGGDYWPLLQEEN